MNAEKTGWIRRFDFALLSGWIVLSFLLVLIAFLWFGKDFRGYYAAAKVLMAGRNPYDYNLVAQVLLEVTGRMGNNPYYYPPWFLWIFTPLAVLPFQAARAVWLVFNLAIWNLGLWQLGRVVGWPRKGWRLYALFIVVTCLFAWMTWKYEQAGILVFLMLVALIVSIQKQQVVSSGIWMALLLIKPNITLIVVAGISLWLLRKAQWRPILVMLATLLTLLFLSTWITPDWFQPFFEKGFGQGLGAVLDGPDKVVALRINTTLPDWLSSIGLERRYHIPIYGISILIGILVFFWSIYKSQSFLELVSILLLISFSLTPYALQYDYPPLAIVLFWAFSRCVLSPKALRAALLLTGFMCSVIFWEQNIASGFWMVVGLIAMAILAMYQKTIQNAAIS
jgi:hypothetical protein